MQRNPISTCSVCICPLAVPATATVGLPGSSRPPSLLDPGPEPSLEGHESDSLTRRMSPRSLVSHRYLATRLPSICNRSPLHPWPSGLSRCQRTSQCSRHAPTSSLPSVDSSPSTSCLGPASRPGSPAPCPAPPIPCSPSDGAGSARAQTQTTPPRPQTSRSS